MQETSLWNLGMTISLEANHSLSALREVSNGGNDSTGTSDNRIPHCEERMLAIPTPMKIIVNMWKHDTRRRHKKLLLKDFFPRIRVIRSGLILDTTCPCYGCSADFYCSTDGPAAGVPGNVTCTMAVCQHHACERLSHNYLAMQHIIQSSSIQMSAQSSHPSHGFLPSQQILRVVGSQGKGLSGSVSASGVCVFSVCVWVQPERVWIFIGYKV